MGDTLTYNHAHQYLDIQVTCTILSLFNTATKRKRPQKPAVQVDDTEIKGMQYSTPIITTD